MAPPRFFFFFMNMAPSRLPHVVIFPFMEQSHTLPLLDLLKALFQEHQGHNHHNPIKCQINSLKHSEPPKYPYHKTFLPNH